MQFFTLTAITTLLAVVTQAAPTPATAAHESRISFYGATGSSFFKSFPNDNGYNNIGTPSLSSLHRYTAQMTDYLSTKLLAGSTTAVAPHADSRALEGITRLFLPARLWMLDRRSSKSLAIVPIKRLRRKVDEVWRVWGMGMDALGSFKGLGVWF